MHAASAAAAAAPTILAAVALLLLPGPALATAAVRQRRAVSFDDVAQFIQLGRDIFDNVMNSWGILDDSQSGENTPTIFKTTEIRLLERITQVDQLVKQLREETAGNMRLLHDAVRSSSRVHDVRMWLREMDKDFDVLDDLHTIAKVYKDEGYDEATGNYTLDRRTLEQLAKHVLSHGDTSVLSVLGRLHRALLKVPARLATEFKELQTLRCSVQQSPQQLIYNLFNNVALSEIRGYTMMQFSWMLLSLYEKGNFTKERSLFDAMFEKRRQREVQAVRAAMEDAQRDLWRCDPAVHIEGETYEQLTRLVQGMVQNEVDMNGEGTCKENCAYYSYAQNTGCFDKRVCQSMPRCKGRLLDCQFIDADMWMCQADSKSTRRYEYLEYENGRTLGRQGTCNRRRYKVDSWWRWLFWHCSYCFCMCDEPGPRSDRYFNLRPVLADVANNMVVTGLRFVKKNRVIHLQIREGTLLPRGAIDASTSRWRPVDDYKITDADVNNGRDFHTLSWEQRGIDLDDLEAPPNHVVTGVRFRNVGMHLNPEILVAPMNFSTGTLIKPNEMSMWISNDNTDGAQHQPRTRLKLLAPDVPTNSHAGSSPDSKSDQYLLFTHSDMDADAAQTTVPFLDAQAVAPEPPVPLAGAGIFHKGTPRYGGFVAPRVFTYDFAPHMSADAANAAADAAARAGSDDDGPPGV